MGVLRFREMRFRSAVRVTVAALIGLLPAVGFGGNLNASQDECGRIAHWQTYSNALHVEEAGDVIGYEMAFQQRDGTSIGALLYVYEGTPNEDGISISGQISGGKLKMKGNWIEHLTEYPSKKEIVETDPVEVSGTLDSKRFRGIIKISDQARP
jgi:hypothetical protein